MPCAATGAAELPQVKPGVAPPRSHNRSSKRGSESNCSIWNAACTLELKYDVLVRVDSKIVCAILKQKPQMIFT